RFEHHPGASIPTVRFEGAALDVIAGTAYGERSPVGVLSPTLYVHAALEAGARFPMDNEHEERAIYVAEGVIGCDGRVFKEGTMVVLKPNTKFDIEAREPARVMLVGGGRLEGERFVWWNFVSSSKERLEKAKSDWKGGQFPKIPGDDVEFIPLPEG
ncbi:MAG TPA: pirin-like C-terminal cupin domain-containing protein, partial [Polyangiaceae bacterium]|nr:pirin-like C-terminal cupin domain-containing protein [Polyangiaceae bacterium]